MRVRITENSWIEWVFTFPRETESIPTKTKLVDEYVDSYLESILRLGIFSFKMPPHKWSKVYELDDSHSYINLTIDFTYEYEEKKYTREITPNNINLASSIQTGPTPQPPPKPSV
jgi:hypothetical protein